MIEDAFKDKESQTSTGAELKQPLRNRPLIGWRVTLLLAINGLGIIYGDIGTSPLYVFNAIFPTSGPVPSEEDIIGSLSAIIWSITIVPLIKYSFIALNFGTGSGEGGPFAVYTSLYPPPEESDENRALTTYTTSSVKPHGSGSSFANKAWVKGILFAWVLFGTCLTMSDGLLTPAVSVVSAVGGIAVAVPKLSPSGTIVGISCAILVLLFAIQPFGTHRVSFLFAPVVAIFLATIGISGIINVVSHPGVFRAFDPSRAIMLFVRTKNFDLLSGVLLAITGVEALFANLGQFSKQSIRLGFAGFVYPCLILAYLGQGARLVVDGADILPNVFYNTIPGGTGNGFWWFTWLFAILAAVVASQAMISATFSLVQQLTHLHAMPMVKITHTSNTVEGQIFVPAVNFLIMIGTIGLTVGFGTNAGLTNAYGFAVSGVLIVTTSILAVAIVRLKHLPVIVAVLFFIGFGFVDALFFGASLKKVPHGAWFTLGMAVVLWVLFRFWSWAQNLEADFDSTHRYRLSEVLSKFSDSLESDELGDDGASAPILPHNELSRTNSNLKLVDGDAQVSRLPVFALFHNISGGTLNGVPHSFAAFLKAYPALPEVTIFFNIRIVGIPHTVEEERYVVSRVRSFDGIYSATLRLGYRDPIDLSNIAPALRDRIVGLEGNDPKRAQIVDQAMATHITHVLPNMYVVASRSKGNRFQQYIREALLETIYRRVKVNFDDYDAIDFGTHDVLRMGVTAAL